MRPPDNRAAPRVMLLLVLVCVVLEGCVVRHGKDLDGLGFKEARGVHVELGLDRDLAPERIAGELIDVSDTTLLVLVSRDSVAAQLWLVRHSDVRSVRSEWATSPQGGVTGGTGGPYNSLRPVQLRRASRFPYGIPAAALERILASNGQTEPRLPARARSSVTAPHHHVASAGPDYDRSTSAAADSFMLIARAATARYHDRSMAIADGYRKLGPAFPGMGEHWVHPGLIVSGRLDAHHPPVLCYANVNGAAGLVAIAYAVPVPAGESAPDTPMGRSIWHQHGNDVDAESLLLVHGSPDDDPTAPRLAMFHAWTGLDNADGVFAQNNWRLPFTQLGLETNQPSAAAAQTLSLLTAGESYYMRLFDAVVEHDATSRDAVRAGFTAAEAQTRQWRASLGERTSVGDNELRDLERIWTELWDSVDASVDARTRQRLVEFPGRG